MSAGNEQIPSTYGSPARDARVRAVIDDCRCRRVAGEVVSDDVLIAAHPELMPEIGDELRKLRIIAAARENAAEPAYSEVALASGAGDNVDTATFAHDDSIRNRAHLEVRCPSCHAPVDLAVDTPLTDVTCSSCGSQFSLINQDDAAQLAPALAMLGRFELIGRLGMGAFGSVWKARDKELDRTVAIKIPRAGGMTAEQQEKFFREARAAAQLRHPNIVSVHEVGRDGDSVYIVSDFVRGFTLGDWLTDQQPTSREAAELCAKIADALHHAHEQGVVHRDLKPANIMIDGDSQPHLMDFGLARREVGEVTVTLDGHILGTPAYMSPEQAQGESHKADRRSDVYSLGVILFQLLTGELPFRGNARMLMHQVIHDEPPSPRKLNANITRDLETITLKCLEKEPAKRYQTANEFADECRRYLNGNPIHARPIGRMARGWRWIKRRPAAAALLGLASSVAIIAPLIALQQASLRQRASNLALTRKQALDELSKKDKELQSQLVRNLIERGWGESEAGRVSHAIALYAGAYVAARPDDPLRVSARNLAAGLSSKSGLQMSLVNESQIEAAYVDDGRRVNTASRKNGMQLWDVMNGNPLGASIPQSEDLTRVFFSIDGRWAVAEGKESFRIWNLVTGKPVGETIEVPRPDDAAQTFVIFSPDSHVLVTATNQTGRLFDVATGKPIGDPMQSANLVTWVKFGPDSRTVLTVDGNVGRLWDCKTAKPVGQPIQHVKKISGGSFSPDSRTVLTESEDFTARLWDARTGKPIGDPMKHDSVVRGGRFSPDSRTVLTGSGDFPRTSAGIFAKTAGAARLWDAQTGKPHCEPMRHDAPITFGYFSSDGLTVLTASGHTAWLWDMKGHPLGDPMRHDDEVEDGKFSRDGRTLLTQTRTTAWLWDAATTTPLREPLRCVDRLILTDLIQDGSVVLTATQNHTRLWRVPSAIPLSEPIRHDNLIFSVAFSPDGHNIVTGSGDFSIDHGILRTRGAVAQVWNTATAKPVGKPMRNKIPPIVAFDSDGHTIFTVDDILLTDSGSLYRWNPLTGEKLGRFGMNGVKALSPDRKIVLVQGRDNKARLWEIAQEKPVGKPMQHDSTIGPAAFSLDGRVLLTSTTTTARLWDALSGQPLGKPLVHDGFVFAVAISPDRQKLLTSCSDGNARIWDAMNLEPIGSPMCHKKMVRAVAFSPDGSLVLTGSDDHTAMLWDANTGKSIIAPLQYNHPVRAAVFSPDGQSVLIAGGTDAQLWSVPHLPDNPELIRSWATTKTGMALDLTGIVHSVSQAEWLKAREELRRLRGDQKLP